MERPSPAVAVTPVRVMVVDDNAGYRQTLLALLDTEELIVVGEASCGEDSVDVAGRVRPDIVLMDVRMPTMDGVEATRLLKAAHPSIGVIALTAYEEQPAVGEMLAAGASGYVLKDADGRNIVEAVRQLARTGAALSPDVAPTVLEELSDALERERERAAQLEAAHAQLIGRIAQRHELVSRLGHELRSPMSVIFGVARTLAAGDVPPEEQADLLQRLVARSVALMKLVNRFEAAVDAELTEPVGMHALATELAGGESRVRIAGDKDLPKVPLNPVLARRVMEELVDNALRFSPEGSPVEVWIGIVGSEIKVKVMDRGDGIAPEHRDRIFEPLQQGEALDSRTHSGAGLGLPLARAAARAMEGEVELEASGPGGSTFVWTIPLGVATLLS